MNDRLEYKTGRSLDPTRWNNLFFSSFMCEDKENIGMWSMYSQPLGEGRKNHPSPQDCYQLDQRNKKAFGNITQRFTADKEGNHSRWS